MTMSEGFFRSKKGFTVVQNELTKDKTISLKAKGLYLVIQAYITLPDKKWTKDDFLRLAKEGSKAFDSAWKELKDNGYLKVHIMADGGKWRTEYELLDAPEDGPHTFYHNSAGEITSDNIRRAAKKQSTLEEETQEEIQTDDHYPPFGSNGKSEDTHYPLFGSNGYGTNGNGINGYGSNANGGNKKNKDLEQDLLIKPLNNIDINNGCASISISNPNPSPAPPLEKYSEEWIKEYFHEKDLIQIGLRASHVDLVMEILFDTINTRKSVLWVNREEKSAAVVKARLLKLNYLDIQYAIEQYNKQTTAIRYHKAYMLSLLYEAKGQGELDYTNQVQHDMYGGY